MKAVNAVLESLTLMWSVLVSPRRAYSQIESMRPFVLVWVIGAAFAILQPVSIFYRLGVNAIVRFGLSQMPELKYSPEQIKTMTRNTATFFPYQVVGTTLLWILLIVVVATVVFELDKWVLKNRRSFTTILSIVSYAQVPQILFSIGVCALLWIIPNPSHLGVNAFVGTNATLLVPFQNVQQFYRVLLSSVDVWTIWSILLLAIGLSSERTRFGKSFSYICGLWLMFVLGKAGISAMALHHAVATARMTHP